MAKNDIVKDERREREKKTYREKRIALLSLLLGGLILYQLDFTGERRGIRRGGARALLFGPVITYALALASSTLVLAFFGRFADTGLSACLAQVVVLAFAGTLGASAGRLLIQS